MSLSADEDDSSSYPEDERDVTVLQVDFESFGTSQPETKTPADRDEEVAEEPSSQDNSQHATATRRRRRRQRRRRRIQSLCQDTESSDSDSKSSPKAGATTEDAAGEVKTVAVESENRLETAAEYWKRKYEEEADLRRQLQTQLHELENRLQLLKQTSNTNPRIENDNDLYTGKSNDRIHLGNEVGGLPGENDSFLAIDPTFLDEQDPWKSSQHILEGFVMAGVQSHLACAQLLYLHASAQKHANDGTDFGPSDLESPNASTNSMFMSPQWVPPETLPTLQPQILNVIGKRLSSAVISGALDWLFPAPYHVQTRTIAWPPQKTAIQDCSDRSVSLLKERMLQGLEHPELHYFQFGCQTDEDLRQGGDTLPSSTRYFTCLLFPQPICLDWRSITRHLEDANAGEGAKAYELVAAVRELLSPASTTHYAVSWKCLSVISRYPFLGLFERILAVVYNVFIFPQIEEELENIARVAVRSLNLTSHDSYQCFSPAVQTGDSPIGTVAPLKDILKEGFMLQRSSSSGTFSESSNGRKRLFSEPLRRLRDLKPWRKHGKNKIRQQTRNNSLSFDDTPNESVRIENGSDEDGAFVRAPSKNVVQTLASVWPKLEQQIECVIDFRALTAWLERKVFPLHPPSPSCTVRIELDTGSDETRDFISWTRPGYPQEYDERLLEITSACRYPAVRDLCRRLAQDHRRISDDVGLPLGSEESNELIQEHALPHVLETIPVHTLVALIGSLLVDDKVIITGQNLIGRSTARRSFVRHLKQHNSFRPRTKPTASAYRVPRSWMQDRYTLSLTVLFLRSIISPLQWVYPVLPIIPVKLMSLLASPVPILAGVDYTDEEDMPTERSLIYSLHDGSLYRPNTSYGGHSPALEEEHLEPQLPNASILHYELSRIASLLRSNPQNADCSDIAFRSHDFCLCAKEHIFCLLVEIWEVEHDSCCENGEPLVSKFRRKLVQEFRHSEIPFWNRFLRTQLVEQYSALMKPHSDTLTGS
eukprot:gb/GECG01010178.1/.p1 GENE.gb/GECG01010178.1/~~gb/GECG01010178.1/.p1  ORF type:complete len:992 (+),score=105.33 gb/GECG01010178.1/:1-2976(+)